MTERKIDPHALDIGYLALFAGWAFADAVQADLAKPMRFSWGFLFQHLVDGERSVRDLAARMEVTQQAVSKTVGELERRGLVRVRPGTDRRVRYVGLTAAGRAAIEDARAARARLVKKLAKKVGERRLARASEALVDVLSALGGLDAVQMRRVRGPH